MYINLNKKSDDEECSHIFTKIYETSDGEVINACCSCPWKYVLSLKEEIEWRKLMCVID